MIRLHREALPPGELQGAARVAQRYAQTADSLINQEIKNKRQGKKAYILAKVNHITDRILIQKLYEASTAGVQTDLVVRGNCSLVTGIPGVSDNIRINGIIDVIWNIRASSSSPTAGKKK